MKKLILITILGLSSLFALSVDNNKDQTSIKESMMAQMKSKDKNMKYGNAKKSVSQKPQKSTSKCGAVAIPTH